MKSAIGGSFQEMGQQNPANSLAAKVTTDIDGIFYRGAVGGTFLIWGQGPEANDLASKLCHVDTKGTFAGFLPGQLILESSWN
jgi:hypothetical protein